MKGHFFRYERGEGGIKPSVLSLRPYFLLCTSYFPATKKSDRAKALPPVFLIKPMMSLWKDLENGCVPAEAVPRPSAESSPFGIPNSR